MNALVLISVFGLFHPSRLQVKADRVYELTIESPRLELSPGCFLLSVPHKIERRFCGGLTVNREGSELVAVVSMPLESATAAVVAAELPSDVPIEAAKAQAILARSYYAAGPRHRGRFCDTTHCQFIRGPAASGSLALRAAEETSGMALRYQGKRMAPLYSASCGGRTFAGSELALSEEPYPYFSVECPICKRDAKQWDRRVKSVPERHLHLNHLPSNFFVVENDTSGILLHGRGEGHGVGLCQRGAIGLAREGRSFREILEYYLPNTALD